MKNGNFSGNPDNLKMMPLGDRPLGVDIGRRRRLYSQSYATMRTNESYPLD